jgi:hypothetical protein
MKRLLIILTALTIFAATAHAGQGTWKIRPNPYGGGYDVTYCSYCWKPGL